MLTKVAVNVLQALSEERASAIEKLQLQLDLASEKVAVLSAEISQVEQESRQVRSRDLQICKHRTFMSWCTVEGLGDSC